jgi:oxygen-dependent protoporphyrinogen oxidase
MSRQQHIAIVGGGITGLVAAYTLQRQMQEGTHKETQVTLLEADRRLGGKIQTIRFAEASIDIGAEALLLLDPVRQLFQELGIESDVIKPNTAKTLIWTKNRLRSLPDGLVMGLPTEPFSIIRSGLVSPLGLIRAGMDLFLPRHKLSTDPSVKEVLGSRLGNEMLTNLIEPLFGGIHAGNVDHLSLAAVAPHILATARKHRSLTLGLRSLSQKTQRGQSKNASSLQLYAFADGLDYLVQRLQAHIEHVDLQLGTRLQRLTRQADGTYHLICSTGEELIADSVILAIPAWEASRLLANLDAISAKELGAIEHASLMVTLLSYPRTTLSSQQLPGNGFLVSRADGHLMSACTWVTKKWARQSSSDTIVLRCSAGRAGDERAAQMSDNELLTTIQRELGQALHIQERPLETLVVRWNRGFPQYNVGHQEKVKRIEMMLAGHAPGLILAGSPYHGIGLAACIKDGASAAQRVQAHLDGVSERRDKLGC